MTQLDKDIRALTMELKEKRAKLMELLTLKIVQIAFEDMKEELVSG